VSPAGRQIDPTKPFDHIDGVPTPEEKSVALERHSVLTAVLQGAIQRLAVSEPFQKVYERAGVASVDVRENQFTPMPPPQPRPQRGSDDPLRICHVGGMAMHKGYYILRQAVHMLPADLKLVFTIVDHNLQADDPDYSSTWNGYPVRFIPLVPMRDMATFYASHDLLVAPSIWPESFGLVTREALSAGLSVIASDIGALALPIEAKENHSSKNRKIKPGSAEDLAMALIDASKETAEA
jgi:glycosyltransferase involved in cell wall biosynthesis